MKYRQGTILQTLQRMNGVLTSNPELAPMLALPGYKALKETIDELSTHASSQEVGTVGSMGETARQRALRLMVRRMHLRPLVAAARLESRKVPELGALAMPDAAAPMQQFLAEAAAMGETARRHETTLIAAGLEPDFLAQLDAAIAELKDSVDGRARHGGRRSGATEGLTESDRRARAVLRIVDAQAMKVIGNNAALLGEWKQASRIGRKPGVPDRVGPTPAPTPIVVPPKPPVSA